MTKKDLYLKIYDELLDNGVIEEHNGNFIDEHTQKEEFLRTLEYVLKEYYILDMLHEIK